MQSIEFVPGVIEGSPKKGLLLRFPDFSLSILITDQGIFAEILKDGERRTFKGKKKEENIEEAVEEVMKKLKDVLEVYQNG